MIISKSNEGLIVVGLTMKEVKTSMEKGPISLTPEEYKALPEGFNLMLAFGDDNEDIKRQLLKYTDTGSGQAH